MKRHFWIPAEDRSLKALYPHVKTVDAARILGRTLESTYRRAHFLGLHKSDAFRASALSGRLLKDRAEIGQNTRFKPGIVPKNKGVRMPGWAPGRMAQTQFKKGQFPANRDPDFYVLGALRVNSEGYIDMRISFELGANGWRALHKILWEDAHGPVPPGHCLIFRDGERLNVCIENLKMITRAEHIRRHSVHNLPQPLVKTIQLLGVLKRTLRRRKDDKKAQHR